MRRPALLASAMALVVSLAPARADATAFTGGVCVVAVTVNFGGNHTISGTWGAWVMSLGAGLTFQGVIELHHNPSFASDATNCAGSGTSTIHMLGVEVFEDPQL